MTHDELQQITIEPQDGSQVKISGEIPFSYLEKHRVVAVKHLGKDAKIPGFREGQIPEKILVERIGEMAILSEMAQRALSAVYPEIIKTHNIEAVGYPEISITKIAQGNPLGFTATVAVYPDITLPDYKAIAQEQNKKKESTDVTDAEVDEQIKDILRQKAAYERLQKKAGETHTHEDGTVHEGPAHDHEDGTATESADKLPLPELTDELVKTLGTKDQFKDVADFKAKIREHLEIQKKQDVHSGHRAKITDAIIEKTEVTLPHVMIDAEINQMFAQMEEDLKRAQLNIDDYLKHTKKTREDLRNEWTPPAEKRAKLQLVLNEIAKKEGIIPDASEADQQVAQLLEHYKDADEARVRIYVESMLKNEAVMKMLETL